MWNIKKHLIRVLSLRKRQNITAVSVNFAVRFFAVVNFTVGSFTLRKFEILSYKKFRPKEILTSKLSNGYFSALTLNHYAHTVQTSTLLRFNRTILNDNMALKFLTFLFLFPLNLNEIGTNQKTFSFTYYRLMRKYVTDTQQIKVSNPKHFIR